MARAVSEAKARKKLETEQEGWDKKRSELETRLTEMQVELESRSQEIEVVKVQTVKAQRSTDMVVQNAGSERGRLTAALDEAWAVMGPLEQEVRELKEQLAARKASEMDKVHAAMKRVAVATVSEEQRRSAKELAVVDAQSKKVASELESVRRKLDDMTAQCTTTTAY